MGFQDELKNARDSLRRLEQSWFEREGEVIGLKKQLAEAKEEVHRLHEHHEPGSRKIAEDCLRCTYRTQAIKSLGLDKQPGSGKMKIDE